ncbi:MAG: THUMP domain-containing protein [Candidatus Odinarchaeia archaeon]
MNDLNLLITCPTGLEKRIASNIYFVLKSDLKDSLCRCKLSSFRGIIYVFTSLKQDFVIQFFKKKLKQDHWYLGNFNKIIPIQLTVPLSENEIISTAIILAKKIKENESYKIEIKNRGRQFNSMLLIEKIASGINRKVDLETPDKILHIEILDFFCGLSLLNDSSILRNVQHVI